MAHAVRISSVTSRADARGDMVDHLALGANATVARVAALLINTGQLWRTLRADHTLGSAADVRVAMVIGHADAGGRCAPPLADGVVAAGGRPARVARLLCHRRLGDGHKSTARRLVRVTFVPRRTAAARPVTDHVAERVIAACARTRVATLLALAAECVGAVRVGEALRAAADVRVAQKLG